jgi:hypothetical protein
MTTAAAARPIGRVSDARFTRVIAMVIRSTRRRSARSAACQMSGRRGASTPSVVKRPTPFTCVSSSRVASSWRALAAGGRAAYARVVVRRKSHPASKPTTRPTSGAKGTSVVMLTMIPRTRPTAPPTSRNSQVRPEPVFAWSFRPPSPQAFRLACRFRVRPAGTSSTSFTWAGQGSNLQPVAASGNRAYG